MAANDRGAISQIVLSTPDIAIGNITDWTISPGLQELVLGANGEVDPTFVAIMAAAMGISFTTQDLAVLGSCGVAGCEVTTGVAYLKKIAAYGTRAGATSHTKITLAKAFMVPRILQASHGAPASLSYDMLAVSSDGTTAPIAISADDQSLAAAAEATEVFTLGDCTINGTDLEVSDVSVDFGLDARVDGGDGNPYGTVAYIMNRAPAITLTTPDRLALATLTIDGVAQGATDSVIQFDKLLASGTRSSSADNVTISINGGHISAENATGSHGERIGTAVRITPILASGAAILVVATDAAA